MYDAIIIGGGPAGMMASIASSKNNKVLLIERNGKLGIKLSMTGGSRCNVTNKKSVTDFISQLPINNKTMYPILNKFSPNDICNYLEKVGVKLKVEDNDRVFPISNNSYTIIDALKNEMIKNNVMINLNEKVLEIKDELDYKVVVTTKDSYKTKKVIISTGGLSYPETGATGDGYKIAKSLGNKVTELYASQTYLVSSNKLNLEGLTLTDINITFLKKKVTGSVLFTHIGLSGPGIFKISEDVYKQLKIEKNAVISLDLLPNLSSNDLLDKLNNSNQKQEIGSFLKSYFSKRLVDYILSEIDSSIKLASISKENKIKVVERIKDMKIVISKTGSIEKSIVTGGGVDMKYVNPNTMESTVTKGIYYAGEVLDLHGPTGGYNITIALSTGYVAGSNI